MQGLEETFKVMFYQLLGQVCQFWYLIYDFSLILFWQLSGLTVPFYLPVLDVWHTWDVLGDFAQNLLFVFLINLPFDIYAGRPPFACLLLVILWKTVNPRSGRWCVLNDKHRKVIVSDGCNPVTTEGVIELEIEMDDFEQEVQHGMQIHHWTIDNLFWSVAKATLSKCCFGKTMPPPLLAKAI